MSFNIQNLKLSTAPRDHLLARRALAADDATAMVGAGQGTVFQDVMDSCLLAQLGASGSFDRFKQTTEWYNEYKRILEGIYWILTSFKFDEHHLSNVAVSVDKVILDWMRTYLTPAQLTLLERVIDALENSQDPAVNIFTTSASSDTQANFQLGVCTEDKDKNPKFSIGCFVYSTDQRITNVLFTKIKSGSAHFLNAFQEMVLSTKRYESIRQVVLDALQKNAEDLIKDLPLPPRK